MLTSRWSTALTLTTLLLTASSCEADLSTISPGTDVQDMGIDPGRGPDLLDAQERDVPADLPESGPADVTVSHDTADATRPDVGDTEPRADVGDTEPRADIPRDLDVQQEAGPPSCRPVDVEGTAEIHLIPPMPLTGIPTQVQVSGMEPLAHVGLEIEGPGGALLEPAWIGVQTEGDSCPCTWSWEVVFPDAGRYCLLFTAEQSQRKIARTEVQVGRGDRDADGDGHSLAQGDCDDGDPDRYPGAPETCGDGVDSNCDGQDPPCVEDPCEEVQGNLLVNGGFEEGEGRFPGVGRGWETNDAQPHPRYHALDRQVLRCGEVSQRIDTHGEWDHWPIRQVSDYGTVQPGRTYELSAQVKSQGNANPNAFYVLGLWWFRDNELLFWEINDRNPDNNNDYDWKRVAVVIEAPDGANRAAAFLSAHFHGVVWYDQVSLVAR